MPQARQGVFEALSGNLMILVLVWLVLRGPQSVTRVTWGFLAALFFSFFLFTTIGLKSIKSQISAKQISFKTHSRSRPRKRLRFKAVKPLKLARILHFQLFFERPSVVQKQSKWKPEWIVWALKITKIQTQENSKKQLPHETVKYVFLDTGGGVSRTTFFH